MVFSNVFSNTVPLWTRDFCAGFVSSDEVCNLALLGTVRLCQLEKSISRNFHRNNFNVRGGGTRRAHHFIHGQNTSLLADFNHITEAPFDACRLLSRLLVNKLQNIPSDTGFLQRCVRCTWLPVTRLSST